MSKVTSEQRGLQVDRLYTASLTSSEGWLDPLDSVEWAEPRTSRIGGKGQAVFEMDAVEAPVGWSQNAVDIVASKYFRKAGVPWSAAGCETSIHQLVRRVSRAIRLSGERQGYFSGENADAFEAELAMILVTQRAAFNSPVWFNLGLKEAYGIAGSPTGNWCWDEVSSKVVLAPDSYTYPQVSACFINKVSDDLMSIADHVKHEMRIFKYGSGAGANYSALRAKDEPLSNGGKSSGLMSFLEVFDRAAGAIKSGGATRRAAKMISLDVDHPDIEEFVEWKVREEDKARVLMEAGYGTDLNGEAFRTVGGQNANNSVRVSDAFMEAALAGRDYETRWRTSGEVADKRSARALLHKIAAAAHRCADPGLQYDDTINKWHTCGDTSRINGSNPCCLVGETLVDTSEGLIPIQDLVGRADLPHAFAFDLEERKSVVRPILRAWVAGETKSLVDVVTDKGLILRTTPEHRFLLRDGTYVAASDLRTGTYLRTACSTPNDDDRVVAVRPVQLDAPVKVYDIEVDGVHNFAVRDAGGGHSIVVHNSEYMYVDDSACNLSSINLIHFISDSGGFKVREFEHTCRVMILAQEILVDHASYPTKDIAENSHNHRPLGLGYANLGGMLMRLGLPYDSTAGRALGASITSLMTATAYERSAEVAAVKGPFAAYAANKQSFRRVVNMHRKAAEDVRSVDTLLDTAQRDAWDRASVKGMEHGYRNAQTTLLAPTGTIGLMMDCDTLGVEPDFSLVKHKKLSGGGSFKIANQSVRPALVRLGYSETDINSIMQHIEDTDTVEGSCVAPAHLAVFDCAIPCGERGTRSIAPMGHVRMMAAVQPFLSGAISKTINMPGDCTVEDIERVYIDAWKLGIKALAVYRDGSKTFQVLHSPKKHTMPQQRRVRLPDKREGHTFGLAVGGQKVYLRTGLYPDGSVGEVFIDMHKEGAFTRSMTNCLAIAVSLGLQHGVPLETFVERFSFTNFAPNGPVKGHPNVKFAGSVIDLIARVLGVEYLDRVDLVQVKPEGSGPSELRISVDQDGMCDVCGGLTRRSGTCAVCDNCGTTTGCS
jgi:ribonucleotide reductase alpha subunit